jgi:phage tail sheath protein FI
VGERGAFDLELTEEDGADLAIERVPTGITAFVGRTLKGPLNRPVTVSSFVEFQQHFGSLWQPSTLSYAIEQYFENGGRKAIIVRVANGASPPSISLPAGAATLRLVGLNPGSREYLRASIDYDGIDETESDRFNLVVQRVRTPGTELIEDQEIFRRVSVEPSAAKFIGDVLLESRLVRVHGLAPSKRPNRTPSSAGGPLAAYVNSNADGADGNPITDYDLIGSAGQASGLFALRGVAFNFLCIPPITRDQDVGLSTLLVAAKMCREQHAILVLDPPLEWNTPQAVIDGMRNWPFRSENAVMYFPRMLAFDRLRNRHEIFGSSAAAAGSIARADESWPVWTAAEADDSVLRPGLRPAVPISDTERAKLAKASVNVLTSVRTKGKPAMSVRTLAAGHSCAPEWKYLAARRLALFIMTSIERGTRWLVMKPNSPEIWKRAQSQVDAFLDSLDRDGAFAGGSPHESYFVICDSRVNRPESIAEGKVNLLFGFATIRPGDFYTCMVTHQPSHSRVRPVAVNRLATSQQRVEWEIETAIFPHGIHRSMRL